MLSITCIHINLRKLWTTMIVLGISIVLFRGNLSSELNLISIYFSSQLSVFFVINLIKSLIWPHSTPYFFVFYLVPLVGSSIKDLFPVISLECLFTLLIMIYKGFTLLILTDFAYFTYYVIFTYFYKSNIVSKTILVWIIIYFNIIWIKKFDINNIIE